MIALEVQKYTMLGGDSRMNRIAAIQSTRAQNTNDGLGHYLDRGTGRRLSRAQVAEIVRQRLGIHVPECLGNRLGGCSKR